MRAAMSRRPTPSQTVLLLRPQEVIPVLDDDRPFVTPVDSPGLAGAALARLWGEVGLPEAALAHVEFTGTDPVLPPSFAVGSAAQASIGAAALAASELWAERGGSRQTVSVPMRAAALEFRSERYRTAS